MNVAHLDTPMDDIVLMQEANRWNKLIGAEQNSLLHWKDGIA